jgi:3-mercaptopyruvate sulfurtransferase SseA
VGERAVRALEGLGYTNVSEYRGGKNEWVEAGLPVESSPSPPIGQWLRELVGLE